MPNVATILFLSMLLRTALACVPLANTRVNALPVGNFIVERNLEQVQAAEHGDASKLLETLRQKITLVSPCKVTTEVLDGDPRTMLKAYAKERGADYLLLGCRGTSGIGTVGSVSDYLIRHADAHVLVFRGGEGS
jgi:nucleotide-binding universal stress UspA family protein